MNVSAPSVTTPFSLHARLILLAVLLCLACTSVLAQTASPDYTNDLTSVDRVKAEIKGSDPTDTLARQVAVFTYLQAYVQRIKYNRSYSGPFTPGEQRLHGQYEMNSDFYKDWSKRLISPQTAAAYKGAETGLAAAGQRRYDQAMADYKRDSAAQQAADKQIYGTQGLSNDPTAVATRRCLELGGSSVGCMGKGLHPASWT